MINCFDTAYPLPMLFTDRWIEKYMSLFFIEQFHREDQHYELSEGVVAKGIIDHWSSQVKSYIWTNLGISVLLAIN
jgi:hypothetical protein